MRRFTFDILGCLIVLAVCNVQATELAPPGWLYERITCKVTDIPGVNPYNWAETTTVSMTCDNGVMLGVPYQVWAKNLPGIDYYVGRTVFLIRNLKGQLEFNNTQAVTCHDIKKARLHGYDNLTANICHDAQYE